MLEEGSFESLKEKYKWAFIKFYIVYNRDK